MKSQVTIGKKLAACFAMMGVLSVAMGVCTWVYIAKLKNELDTAVHRAAKKVEIMADIKTAALTFRLAQRGILLFSSINNAEKVQLNKELFAKSMAGIGEKIRALRPLLVLERGRQLADSIESGAAEYARIQPEIVKMCTDGQVREAVQMDADRLVPVGAGVTKNIDELLSLQQRLSLDAFDRADEVSRKARVAVGILLALGMALIAVAAVVIRRSTRDLHAIASELAEGADQISSAASQVSASSQSLAQASSEQAASLEETSASSEQINSMTQRNAQNSGTAADNMAEASDRIGDANRNLDQMAVSMNEINASSDKISKIIKVIDEIAFQTNILALNAAVEAARAGEAGMGFAVVADEVRNLAQRCAQAAKDTTELIEESVARSNDGKAKLDHVAAAVRSITESAVSVKTLVDEVKLGSQEQARGIEQVAKAVLQMQQVTQTTAAHAEESASACEELSAQSDTLRALVLRLHGMVGGTSGAGTRSRPFERKQTARLAMAERPHTQPPKRVSAVPYVKPASLAAVHAGKDAFPLDEDFKEF